MCQIASLFFCVKSGTNGYAISFQILHLFLVLLLNPYSSDLREERKKNNLEIAFGWCKTWILENICTSLGKKDSNKSDQTGAGFFFFTPSLFHHHHIKQENMTFSLNCSMGGLNVKVQPTNLVLANIF